MDECEAWLQGEYVKLRHPRKSTCTVQPQTGQDCNARAGWGYLSFTYLPPQPSQAPSH